MSAASPGVVSVFVPDRHYNNHAKYVGAIAEAMRPEYRAIVDAGITLQIDCPDLAMVGARYPQPGGVPHVRGNQHRGLEPRARRACHRSGCASTSAGATTRDRTTTTWTSRTSSTSSCAPTRLACQWRHAIHVTRTSGVSSRTRRCQTDRYVVPGVIDSTNNFVEHPDLVAERLLNYASVVGAERVMAGSDCGFGTFAGVSNVAPSVVWAKFRAMSEGARRAAERVKSSVGGTMSDDVGQVRRLLALYCQFMDGRRYPEWSQLFADDGIWALGGKEYRGPSETQAYMDQLLRDRPQRRTQHVNTNL